MSELSKKLTDRDLVTAVIEQCNVVHKDYSSGIIRQIEIGADHVLIEFQDTDGYYHEDFDKAEEFEWAEGFEDYGEAFEHERLRAAINQAISNMQGICNLTDDKTIDEIATRTAEDLNKALKGEL